MLIQAITRQPIEYENNFNSKFKLGSMLTFFSLNDDEELMEYDVIWGWNS